LPLQEFVEEDTGEGRKQSFLAADSATINNHNYEKTSIDIIIISIDSKVIVLLLDFAANEKNNISQKP